MAGILLLFWPQMGSVAPSTGTPEIWFSAPFRGTYFGAPQRGTVWTSHSN